MSCQINLYKSAITGLIGKRSCKKQKKNIRTKKLLSIMHKTKKILKKKSREHYKNLWQEEKDKIKEYQSKRYQELVQYKKEARKNKKNFFVLCLI